MARSQLNRAAKKIGAAMGRADRTAHKAAKKTKQVESLKRQIQKTTKRLKHALS
jgi:hypothetical protein